MLLHPVLVSRRPLFFASLLPLQLLLLYHELSLSLHRNHSSRYRFRSGGPRDRRDLFRTYVKRVDCSSFVHHITGYNAVLFVSQHQGTLTCIAVPGAGLGPQRRRSTTPFGHTERSQFYLPDVIFRMPWPWKIAVPWPFRS